MEGIQIVLSLILLQLLLPFPVYSLPLPFERPIGEKQRGLVGYMCTGKEVTTATISLVQTPECMEIKNNTVEESVSLVVTQTKSIGEVEYYRCYGMADHMITRCGKTIDQQANGGFYSEIIRFNYTTCRNLIENGILSLTHMGIPPIYADVSKGRIHDSFTTIGSIKPNGDCSPGDPVSVNNRVYDRPIRNTKISVSFKKAKARVDYDSQYIMFQNGVKCNYKERSCFDYDYGHLYWELERPDCDEGHKSIVYRGSASKITEVERSGNKTYIQVTQSSYDFQFLLKEKTTICGRNSYSTEHPRLFVTLVDPTYDSFPVKNRVEDIDLNLMLYVNSKLMYSMRHTKAEVTKLFDLFKADRCKTQNRITANMLTLAMSSPKDFSYEYFNGPGYTAVTRGEAVYIAKCEEVAVQPIGLLGGKCYNEMPVVYNNQTYFMVARNRVLLTHGTEIPCTPGLHPLFLVNDKWVTPTVGGLIEVAAPIVVSPESIEYQFNLLNNLASGGLYTKEAIDNLQKVLVSPMENQVIVNQIVGSLEGSSSLPAGYRLSNAFQPLDYDTMRSKVES